MYVIVSPYIIYFHILYSDITYLYVNYKPYYLCTIIDLFYGKVVAYNISDKMNAVFVVKAFNQGKTTWQSIIRSDIDHAISTSYSFGEFLMDMEHMGYEIKHSKYLAFRPYGKERFSRCYKLGSSYSEEEIRARIDGEKSVYITPIKMDTYSKKLNSHVLMMPDFIKQYWRRMYSLNLVKKHKAPPRVSKYLKQDLQTADRYKEQFKFLKAHNLETESEFLNYVKQLDKKIAELSAKLRSFDYSHKKDKKLYDALADIEKYKKPYELYQQGYTMMKNEYDNYLKADKYLKDNGFITAAELDAIKSAKIKTYEQRDEIKKGLQLLRNEKRICDNIQKTTDHIKEQNKQIEQQKTISRKKEKEHTK